MKRTLTLFFLYLCTMSAGAQVNVGLGQGEQVDVDGNITQVGQRNRNGQGADSLGTHKEIPRGIKVWTVDERFGDRTPAVLDTMPHLYPNTIFTTGIHGDYNTTGNLGAPRQNRLFFDRPEADEQFVFTVPYDYFIVRPGQFHFTNTLSPFTNLSYNNAGNRTNGEDHFTAKFGVNSGKRIGVGFKFDYLYGRGYYANQASAHFNYTMYGSYLGDHYQAHLLFSTNHQKLEENGGISSDRYITNPESFDDNYAANEIPTVLERNWNRNDNQHIFFTQRYSLGFNRKVRMTEDEIKARKFAIASKHENEEAKRRKQTENDDEDYDDTRDAKSKSAPFKGRPEGAKIVAEAATDSLSKAKNGRIQVSSKQQADSLLALEQKAKEDTAWLKNEYVPVTSFIHTVSFDNYRRIYQAYETPEGYYANSYKMDEQLPGDSIYDMTRHFRLRNTFALSLLEGFNKWAKAGVKAFLTHELRHFTLPDSVGRASWNENTLSAGGELSKTQGSMLHFNLLGEVFFAGADAGRINLDAKADLNFPLFGDTVTLAANAFFHRYKPTFYFRHYHSRHFLWDADLDNVTHSRIEGVLASRKTGTRLRVGIDELTNYTYLGMSYTIDDNSRRKGMTMAPRQSSSAISVLSAQLMQDFRFGPLFWETIVTWQKSTQKDILPLPTLNVWTNLYLKFRIAHVLSTEFGADARYFTKYYAPDYSPALGQFAVQEGDNRVETGNYPLVNVYLNFHLKHTRFFVMFSHVNEGSGKKSYFLTPHYPLNPRILRVGVSWNFFN